MAPQPSVLSCVAATATSLCHLQGQPGSASECVHGPEKIYTEDSSRQEREREARLPDQRQLHIKKGAGWGGMDQDKGILQGGVGGDKLWGITDDNTW